MSSFVLTEHFTLEELTVTKTGLPNVPNLEQCYALRALCSAVLEPIRREFGGKPLTVDSGFRSLAVNNALRARGYTASTTSQHMLGMAADILPPEGMSKVTAFQIVEAMMTEGLPVDQLLVYEAMPHLHISHSHLLCRREARVVLAKGGTQDWATYRGPLKVRA